MFHEFFYQIKDKINLKFKTKDDLNFYEIGIYLGTPNQVLHPANEFLALYISGSGSTSIK